MSHGWVIPNPGGVKARCGGPGICEECNKEKNNIKKFQVTEIIQTSSLIPNQFEGRFSDGDYLYAHQKRGDLTIGKGKSLDNAIDEDNIIIQIPEQKIRRFKNTPEYCWINMTIDDFKSLTKNYIDFYEG